MKINENMNNMKKIFKYSFLTLILLFFSGCTTIAQPEKEIFIQEKTIYPTLPSIEIPELNLEELKIIVPDKNKNNRNENGENTSYVCFDYENWVNLKNNLIELTEYIETLKELIEEENKIRETWRNENMMKTDP
jgi:hypothetical protein